METQISLFSPSTNYEKVHFGKQNELIPKNSTVDKYPILIKASEKTTMNWSHVINILHSKVQLPSQAANLYSKELDPVIMQLNELFKKALENYTEQFKLACLDDERAIKQLSKNYKSFSVSVVTITTGAAGLGAAGGTLIIPIIGTIAGAAIGAIAGFFGSFFGGKKVRNFNIERNGSVNRIKALQAIDTLENERLKTLKLLVTQRIIVLKSQLDSLGQNQTDLRLLTYLSQLWQMKKSFLGDELINNLNHDQIEEYLRLMKTQFSALEQQ
ncbi:hypothetical protein BN1013_01616 [Candidatus Rubidus massiliensis]|nr:hypothetical protein BN1013_01616 [Candidatus Rubidus massiliensis]